MIKSSLYTRSIHCRSNYDQHLELKTYGTYSRQELFGLVWSEPISKLAPVFGVSTTLISEACKEHHIPTPPRGYWSKVRAGRELSKPQLPSRPLGMSDTVKLGRPRHIKHARHTCFNETLADVRKRVAATINQQNHHGTQRNPHAKRTEHMWHLLTAILAGFEGKVLFDAGQPSKAIVKLHHQQVALWILDSKPTRKAATNAGTVAFRPLELRMAEGKSSKEICRTWQDEDGVPIGANVSEIATEIIVCAELQQRRADAKVCEAQFPDQQQDQLDKLGEQDFGCLVEHGGPACVAAILLKQAKDYERSKSLHSFLKAVQKAFPSTEDVKIKQWCGLISTQIEALDPLTNKRFLQDLDIEDNSQPRFDRAA